MTDFSHVDWGSDDDKSPPQLQIHIRRQSNSSVVKSNLLLLNQQLNDSMWHEHLQCKRKFG